MDEVTLTFDVPSNKTVDVKGAKTIMIKIYGNEKTRYTVVLACCADGTKLPPLLIFIMNRSRDLCKRNGQSGLWHQLITLHRQEE